MEYFQKPASSESDYTQGWKDNIQFFSTAKGNGTTEPVWSDTGNGLYGMLFTAGDELFVPFHVNHDYAQGTNGYPHIHWLNSTTMTVGATVTWRIQYTIAKGHSQGQSLTGTPATFDMLYTATGTELAGEHIITECSDAQAFDLIEPDTVIMMGVKLQAKTTLGNVFGILGDLHYQADREVTPSKEPNFYI